MAWKARSSALRASGSSPGAHQLQAEIRQGARVARVERHGFPRQRDRLVEAIVPRSQIGRNAVHLTEGWVDGKDPPRLRVERLPARPHVCDGCQQRPGVEIRLVALEGLVDPLPGGIEAGVVEIELCEGQMRVDERRVNLQRFVRGLCGCRRILVRERARHACVRGRPFGISLQRGLECVQGIGGQKDIEKLISPCGGDRRIGSTLQRGAIERVRIVRPVQRVRGAAGAQQRLGIRSGVSLSEDAIQQPRRLVEVTEPLMQQAQFERCVALRIGRRRRLENLHGLVVRATRDSETSQDRRRSRIVRRTRLGESFRFRRTTVRDRATRRARKRLVRGRVLRTVHRRALNHGGQRQCQERETSHEKHERLVRGWVRHGPRAIIEASGFKLSAFSSQRSALSRGTSSVTHFKNSY